MVFFTSARRRTSAYRSSAVRSGDTILHLRIVGGGPYFVLGGGGGTVPAPGLGSFLGGGGGVAPLVPLLGLPFLLMVDTSPLLLLCDKLFEAKMKNRMTPRIKETPDARLSRFVILE